MLVQSHSVTPKDYGMNKIFSNILVALPLIALITSAAASDVQVLGNDDQQGSNATAQRTEKFLSLFSVVRFANTVCYGSNGYNGTCLTSTECSQNGGTASGACASGFGVCCTVFITTCGTYTSLNNTYWQNPGYSSTYSTAGQCSLYVQKCASNICQLRLDFVAFVLASPDASSATTYTQCLVDMFTVSGQSNNVPGICGTNTNQHMYIDLAPGTNQITLNMLLTGTTTSRTWNIRIAQIPCGTSYTAPDGCLQWYTTATGTLMSFDYLFLSASTYPIQKLANQDYTICIRTNQGFCGICYTVCTGIPTAANAFLIGTSATATAIDTACYNDWIQIPCAIDYQNSGTVVSAGSLGCSSRICGAFFSSLTAATANAPVYSYRKPFEVRVFFDSYDAANTYGIGFCLQYTQQPCTSTSG